jgi:predicted O-methyltransferase YrrM
MQKIFSVPLNPKLSPDQYKQFIGFVQMYKDFIYDIYFTSRIAPFNQDAMGDQFQGGDDDNEYMLRSALYIQEVTGVPVSATFNNIQVRPDQKNLDIFIKNFKPLYDAGIRTATIPHTHWMATGLIKHHFPDLKVKNTILNDVHTATEVVNLAKYGFDYINLDRDLMRDKDTLLRIKDAKEWIKTNLNKEISISLLANEGCMGQCPMMVEHFHFNNTRTSAQPQYFNDPISCVSCPKWDVEDPAVQLKTADLPPWKEDWEEFINDLGIDVFKMHGRESILRLAETINIIQRWGDNKEILFDKFDDYINETNLSEKPINVWRKKIKNCKFDCWECQYCDKIYKVKSPVMHSELAKHVVDAVAKSFSPTLDTPISGLTSARVKTLLNNIAQGTSNYLELGSSIGATMSAVLDNNLISAYSIDLWEDNIQPKNELFELPENSKDTFLKNIEPYVGNSSLKVLQQNMFEVDLSEIEEPIQFLFYDGEHDFETTKNALKYYYSALDNEAVIVLDDANWQGTVDAANEAMLELGAHKVYAKMILGDEEDAEAWWNGLYIMVVHK